MLATLQAKLIAAAVCILIGAVSLWLFAVHERHVGAAQCAADVRAAAAVEQAREAAVNDYWQKWAAGAAADAEKRKANIDELQKQVAVESANSHAVCLPARAVDRLRAIHSAGGKTESGTPAGGSGR